MISLRTWVALVIALLAACGAHASGMPWWVNHPAMGDAFDVGVCFFVIIRCLLALDSWARKG